MLATIMDHCINNASDARGFRAVRRRRDTNESYLRTKLRNSRGPATDIGGGGERKGGRQQWKWTPRALGGPPTSGPAFQHRIRSGAAELEM